MEEVKKKLWNIELVVEDIKKFPQTYKTILKELYSDGTSQTILRRKLNKLIKNGIICKTTIPGTRFGKSIFYVVPKDYFILVEGTRTGSEVYVFFNYEKLSTFYIRLVNYWVLKYNGNISLWEEYDDEKVLFQGHTLKFI